MGSASREALQRAKSALSVPLAPTTGAELLAASAQIGGNPGLLSALSDASAAPEAKRQLVERLFAKATSGARGLLSAAAVQSWSNADEFVAGIEELGLRADAIAAPGLASELLASAAVIDSNHELELNLGNKLGDPAAKAALVDRLFSGKASAAVTAIVRHLVVNPRGRKLSPALRASAAVVADQNGSSLATVTAAATLTDQQLSRLSALLEKSAGRSVQVTTVIDPDLVGGMRVKMGDHVIDGTVRSRLDDLRLRLAG